MPDCSGEQSLTVLESNHACGSAFCQTAVCVHSPEEIVEAEGLAALGGAEVVVLGSLSTQIRSCIGTCGGGGGAAARGDCWCYLFGFITIWLGESCLPPS